MYINSTLLGVKKLQKNSKDKKIWKVLYTYYVVKVHHTRHIKVVKWCQTWHHFFQDPTQKLWQKIHSLTQKKWMAYLIHFETYSPMPGSGKYNFRKKTCLFLVFTIKQFFETYICKNTIHTLFSFFENKIQ